MFNTTTSERPRRQLAERAADGIEVTLLWSDTENSITVEVRDSGADNVFEFPVARDRALDAFYHPYAYAAQQGIHYELAHPIGGDSLGSISVTQ
jgi:hypothetical protein